MTSSSETVPETYILKGCIILLSYGLHITKHLLIISYSYVFMYQYLHLYFSFGTCIASQINYRASKGPFGLTTESPISIVHRLCMLYSCGRAISDYTFTTWICIKGCTIFGNGTIFLIRTKE